MSEEQQTSDNLIVKDYFEIFDKFRLLSLYGPWPYGSGPMALALRPWPYSPMAPYSCFKNSEKWRCSVFVNLHVLRVLFCQPVFSIFEFYAGNYAFVFAFEY